MQYIPTQIILWKDKKSQEIVKDFLQQERANFRCQKQTFQIVLPQNMFHTINPVKQIHPAHLLRNFLALQLNDTFLKNLSIPNPGFKQYQNFVMN